ATVVSESGNIEVVYFHYTRRCVTCKIVESTTNDVVIDLYGDKIPFTSYDLDQWDGKQKAQELGVMGQALLIVNGEKMINIINEGFMYSRTNPEKYKQVISEKVTSLL
ncbi:MAG: nitrophenyl compound nitroreductase subunit ArsF family protein, partial [Bacteroidales bacterium]|nr:nitrophenyl compound nitroreductase subunit ArsF family protein [Bacteroidales bacterium]